MPFPATWIEERLRHARQHRRLAHAYLLHGNHLDPLRALFMRLAALLLDADPHGHPDLHVIQPESKSRRLTVEQIRNLEQQLQLKARQAPTKVAGVVAADRMCIGSAEAANAFLKTLEEPPDNTVIFLLTDRLEQLLPTIRSRCLILPVAAETDTTDRQTEAPLPQWAEQWLAVNGTAADQAYRRAGQLAAHWQNLRSETEQQLANTANEEVLPALIEAEYLLVRDQSIRTLILGAWRQLARPLAIQVVNNLEELRYALSRNMEQNLALERTCLKISGLIEDKF